MTRANEAVGALFHMRKILSIVIPNKYETQTDFNKFILGKIKNLFITEEESDKWRKVMNNDYMIATQ